MSSNRKKKKAPRKPRKKIKSQSSKDNIIINDNINQKLCDANNTNEIKVAVFFDTNKIEARFSNAKCGDLYLSEVKASSDFYEVKNYIEDSGLSKDVKLCVSEISIREYKQHLMENFTEHSKGFSDNIDGYKKSFGSILDVTYEFNKKSIAEFEEHVESIFSEFLYLNKCKNIEYVRDVDFFNTLVDKAIKKEKPFVSIGANKKLYKDAGFKDAIIIETIIRYHKEQRCKCILVTDDNDFNSAFQDSDGIIICKDATNVKNTLSDWLSVSNIDIIKYKFGSDKYIQESIISETGNTLDESVTIFDVVSVKEKDENLYSIEIHSVINEVVYRFTCKYESISNEIFDVVYTTEND